MLNFSVNVVKATKNQDNFEIDSMPPMNFWGAGAYKDDLDFSRFDSLALFRVVK